ncbi:type VI secretion system baseplate subunit TssF [Burkholderia sp. LMG 32019]|uniref:type VI secretion system baseplate subunit TssF n=1 Tax=Burkholderia sp. LMG 32019 TaxID=3158173 RepID=UPI003C2D4C35
MEDLLPFYERELTLLRQRARKFAADYPKVASRLLLAGGTDKDGGDHSVERMFEAFAFIAARATRRIDDNYPEFAEGLIETMYPHYLRPFPSCSIVRFDVDAGRASRMSSATVVRRGTQLYSRPVRGTKIMFRTAYDVALSPLQLVDARFEAVAQAPRALRVPPQTASQISLTFSIQSAHASLEALNLDSIRLYTQGTPLLCAALRDALSMHALRAYVEPDRSGKWVTLEQVPFTLAGLRREDGLIPFPEKSNPAYLFLTEYFAYPEKFGFFDCDLRQIGRIGGRHFTLHILLKDVMADSPAARALENLGAENILLGCTPVVNLFNTAGKLSGAFDGASATDACPLVVDEQNIHGYQVYSVDAVEQTRETPQGAAVTRFESLHALNHAARPETRHATYWCAGRDTLAAHGGMGQELVMRFVNGALEPVPPPPGLDFKLTCSNRDLAEHLEHGAATGDLMMEGGTLARRIMLLHAPTKPQSIRRDDGALWRLISQLAFSPVALMAGAQPIRDLLSLHNPMKVAAAVHQIDGVVDLHQQAATAWLPIGPCAGVVRGIELRLTIEETHFAGTGIYAFARMLDDFLSLHVSTNGFTQLVLLSSEGGRELLRCPRRPGTDFLL